MSSTSLSATASRATTTQRVAAKGIDLIIFLIVAVVVPYPVGPLLGFVYSVAADAFCFGPFQGQSVGKRLLKLKVVSLKRPGKPPELKESLLRNAPIGFVTFLSLIPIPGWFLAPILGVPLFTLEIVLMRRIGAGQRLGDVLGDTEVIDAKL